MQKRTKWKNLELIEAHPQPTPTPKNNKTNPQKTPYIAKKTGRVKINKKNTKKCDFSKRAR